MTMTTPNYHNAPRETSQDEDHHHVRWERRDEKEYRVPTRTIEQSRLALLFFFSSFFKLYYMYIPRHKPKEG